MPCYFYSLAKLNNNPSSSYNPLYPLHRFFQAHCGSALSIPLQTGFDDPSNNRDGKISKDERRVRIKYRPKPQDNRPPTIVVKENGIISQA